MTEFSKERLLSYMSRRYDYYSARIQLNEALKVSSVPDKASYSQAEIGAICDALAQTGTQQDDMLSSIRIWVGLEEPPPEEPAETEAKPQPEAKPEAKPEPKPEAKPEPKPEAKPEPKPEAKPEPKPEAKPEPAPKEKKSPTEAEISVVVRAVPSDVGQQLVMTGDGDLFGEWDPTKGLKLEADPDGVWHAKITQKVGAELAFKFVLTSNGEAVWEDGDNRKYVVPTEEKTVFDTEWQPAP